MEVPFQHSRSNSARDFFLHLGSMAALYTVVGGLLNLLFVVINKAFPGVGETYSYYYSSHAISFPVALLVVVFPIFIGILWFLEKVYATDPEKRTSGLKKWLGYATLFVAGVAVAGDLIGTLYLFLDGRDLTAAFFLKALSIFVVAVMVFWYYVCDLKNKNTSKTRKVWVSVAACVVVASIVLGFAVIGSPHSQMMKKYDFERTSALYDISFGIDQYYAGNKSLPKSLSDVDSYSASKTDPRTKEAYEYRVVGDLSYELCATFETEVAQEDVANDMYGYKNHGQDFKVHSAGRQCFSVKQPPYQSQKDMSVPAVPLD